MKCLLVEKKKKRMRKSLPRKQCVLNVFVLVIHLYISIFETTLY